MRVVTDGSTTSNITYVASVVETGLFLGERTRYFHADHLGSLMQSRIELATLLNA